MYSGYGNECAWEVAIVNVYARPEVRTPVRLHTCSRIKSFPPIPPLSIMFGGCSSFLSVWLCCCAVMANYLDSLLTALRQLNSQMENRRGNLSEMSSLRVELKSDSFPTCVYNTFTGKRDGVCLANCWMPPQMLASQSSAYDAVCLDVSAYTPPACSETIYSTWLRTSVLSSPLLSTAL